MTVLLHTFVKASKVVVGYKFSTLKWILSAVAISGGYVATNFIQYT